MNYFQLFDLPLGFDVDQGLLAERYRELQKAVHPDNFASASEKERLLSVHKAAEINDAFQTLRKPIPRAEYLLRLNGIELRGEAATIKDPMFLMQQMELRETLEEIPSSNDPESAAFDFSDGLEQQHRAMTTELVSYLEAQKWSDAADCVRKLKFIHKLEEELTRLEEQWVN